MSIVNSQVASEVISSLIRGAQLDTIRVYSLIIQLGFVRIDASEELPAEIWVSVSGNLLKEQISAEAGDSNSAGDQFGRRAIVLAETYLLIGKEVTAASVSESGTLHICLGGASLRAEADNDGSLEEVWTVMSDTPDTTADHRWYVVFDDSGVLSARIPPSASNLSLPC